MGFQVKFHVKNCIIFKVKLHRFALPLNVSQKISSSFFKAFSKFLNFSCTLSTSDPVFSSHVVINREKSLIDPVQKLTFLGMEMCSITMTVPPGEEEGKLLSQIQQMLKKPEASTHDIMSLIGQLEAIKPAFSLAPLYCRRIKHWLLTRLKVTSTPSYVAHRLGQDQLNELRLWIKLLSILQPQPIVEYRRTAVRFKTDGSLTGWGSV